MTVSPAAQAAVWKATQASSEGGGAYQGFSDGKGGEQTAHLAAEPPLGVDSPLVPLPPKGRR